MLDLSKVKRQKRNLLIFVLAITGLCFMLLGFAIELWLVGMAWNYM